MLIISPQTTSMKSSTNILSYVITQREACLIHQIITEKVQEQSECHSLLVLYINMIRSALSLFGINVYPDVYLCLNSAHSPVIFHFIQVFLPQVNWPLSKSAFRKAKERGCLCVLGLEGAQKKERMKEIGWGVGF